MTTRVDPIPAHVPLISSLGRADMAILVASLTINEARIHIGNAMQEARILGMNTPVLDSVDHELAQAFGTINLLTTRITQLLKSM